MGQVCPKHEEFYEGKCRWCEEAPEEEKAGTYHATLLEYQGRQADLYAMGSPYAPNGSASFQGTYTAPPPVPVKPRCFCCGAVAEHIVTMSQNIELFLCGPHATAIGAPSRRL